MKTRILSGIVLGILIAVLFIFGGPVMLIALTIISMLGYLEWVKVLKTGSKNKDSGLPHYQPYLYIGLALILIWYLLLAFCKQQILSGPLALYFVLGIMAVMMITSIAVFPKRNAADAALTLTGVVYTGMMLSCVYLVRQTPKGQFWVWYLLFVSWGSDTCAYFVGRALGKHKMAPVLSPHKTVEGAAGGIVGSILLCLLFGLICAGTAQVDMGVMIKISLLIGLVGAVVSELGDLFASSIKRTMNVKDYSHLIPGHGGILDRFDSMILAAPFVMGILHIFGAV
jgi:phosphatidate cytidylyltransferase